MDMNGNNKPQETHEADPDNHQFTEDSALVGTIDSSEILASSYPAGQKMRVKLYDFKRPDKFSMDQIRTIAVMHETFARLASTSLSAALRYNCNLHVQAVDQMTYGEFLESIPNPSTMGIVQLPPLYGSCLLEIDNSITFPMIERLAGKELVSQAGFNRDLTDIEACLMEGIYARILSNLKMAWSTVIDMDPALGQIETHPDFAMIVPPTEMVFLVSFQCSLGDISGMINLCVPYLTIEPIIGKLSAQYWYSQIGKKGSSTVTVPQTGRLKSEYSLSYEGESLSLQSMSQLKRGSLVEIPGMNQNRAALSTGGKIILELTKEKTAGLLRAFKVVENNENDFSPDLFGGTKKPSDKDKSAETLLSDSLAVIERKILDFNRNIEKRLTEISYKQDELADQVFFNSAQNPSVDGESEAALLQRPFELLHSTEASNLFMLIKQEHPQIVALILSYLEPYLAGNLLSMFNSEQQIDIAERIAEIDRTAPEVLEAIEDVLKRKLKLFQESSFVTVGGVKGIVDILNTSMSSVERTIVEGLEKKNNRLADEIKQNMFIFEDIILLDQKAVKVLVSEVKKDDLLLALKGLEANVKEHILGVFPEDDRKKLEAEIEQQGKLLLRDVEAARHRILVKIRALEESGRIVVARFGEIVD